jgi:hypothetical protein
MLHAMLSVLLAAGSPSPAPTSAPDLPCVKGTLTCLPCRLIGATCAPDAIQTYLVSFEDPALLEQTPDALKLGSKSKAAMSAFAKAKAVQDQHNFQWANHSQQQSDCYGPITLSH